MTPPSLLGLALQVSPTAPQLYRQLESWLCPVSGWKDPQRAFKMTLRCTESKALASSSPVTCGRTRTSPRTSLLVSSPVHTGPHTASLHHLPQICLCPSWHLSWLPGSGAHRGYRTPSPIHTPKSCLSSQLQLNPAFPLKVFQVILAHKGLSFHQSLLLRPSIPLIPPSLI